MKLSACLPDFALSKATSKCDLLVFKEVDWF